MAGFGFGNVGFVGSLGGGTAVVADPNVAPAGIMKNPDFNFPLALTGWEAQEGTSIANGKAVFTNTLNKFFYQAAANYSPALVNGTTYKLAFLINPGSTGTLRAVFNSQVVDTLVTGAGLKEFTFLQNGGDMTFNFQDKGFTGTVEWCQISAV